MRITKIRVTEDHIKLLRRAYITWEDCEFGAPAIDCKRPYGNSSVLIDIAEILGIAIPKEDDWEWPEGVEARMRQLHRETQTVLQIILSTGEMKPGLYALPDGIGQYGIDWQRIGE